MRCYRKAAEQGDSQAMYNLGCCYRDGNGVPRDTAEAAYWFFRAAKQGNHNAREECRGLNAERDRFFSPGISLFGGLFGLLCGLCGLARKRGCRGKVCFAPPAQVDLLVTEKGLGPEARDALRRSGVGLVEV